MSFLHAHSEHSGNIIISVFEEVFLHGLLDTLKIIPFLFLTYLLMEFIEHKASDKTQKLIKKSGKFAPVAGGLLGAVPQCGFSAAASNFYAGRVITLGTLVAVFLSTSDEMLPILISGKFSLFGIVTILLYKALIGILVGFSIDIFLRLTRHKEEDIDIDAICESDSCHCENGILRSALHHTVSIGFFVLLVTLLLNALIFFVGDEALRNVLYNKPVISHAIAAVFGLIPNCAASVALSDLFVEGFITAGTMISGLFSGAGVGLLVLFKTNRKRIKENLAVMAILVLTGFVFGLIFDLTGLGSFI